MEEIIIEILKDYIKQYDKINTMNVGMCPDGRNVIYKKIKMSEIQREIFSQYIDMKGENKYE